MSKATRTEDKAAQREQRYAPRRPKRDPATYQLPQLIAVAVSTNRGQLCEMYAEQIMATPAMAGAITPRQIADMARLLGDLLEDRSRETLRLQDLQTALANVNRQVAAFQVSLEDALSHASGEDLEDDEADDSDALFEACVRNGADRGAAASWPDSKRRQWLAEHVGV